MSQSLMDQSKARRWELMISSPYLYSALFKPDLIDLVHYVRFSRLCASADFLTSIISHFHLERFILHAGELLQTMCDPLKLNGETGYYLASFHAAMTHIGEIDLTEDDELSIFLDILPD